ncbi:MAG: serine hydrolase, partial [Deltaproteobacteria bacterium]|nr:serine hydrolase [Deltaproteobacteria bacterium]
MRWWGVVTLGCVGLMIFAARDVAALTVKSTKIAKSPSTILIDAASGQVMRENDADRSVPIGSLYELMVLLLTSEQDGLGTLHLDVPVTISSAVADLHRSPSAVKHGAQNFDLTLRSDRAYMLNDLLKAVAVSGSDQAALAVAEAISGSAVESIESMNARAARLGMSATHFAALCSVK